MPEPLVPSCAICPAAHLLPGSGAYTGAPYSPVAPGRKVMPCRPATRACTGLYCVLAPSCRGRCLLPCGASGRADPEHPVGTLVSGASPLALSLPRYARTQGTGCRGSGAWAKRPRRPRRQADALWAIWPNSLEDQGFTPGRRQTVCYAGWHVENVSTAQPERQARGAKSSHNHRASPSVRLHVCRLPGISPGSPRGAPGAASGHPVWRRRAGPGQPGHRPGHGVRGHGQAQ